MRMMTKMRMRMRMSGVSIVISVSGKLFSSLAPLPRLTSSSQECVREASSPLSTSKSRHLLPLPQRHSLSRKRIDRSCSHTSRIR